MTPQEKAQELVIKYVRHVWLNVGQGDAPKQYKEEAKQCAIIAVEEVLNLDSVYHDYEVYNYWDAVKVEIKNL